MANGIRFNIEIPPVLAWGILVYLTLFVVVLSQFDILRTADMDYFWFSIYGLSTLMIVNKLRKGIIFEPIVIVPSAYLLMLVIGAVLFDIVKARAYNNYLSNFIGIGYLGLLLGILLSQNYRYTITINRVKDYFFIHHVMKNRILTYCIIVFSTLATFALFAKGGIPMLATDVNQARLDLLTGMGYLNIFLIGLSVLPLAILYDCIGRESRTGLILSHAFAGFVFVLLFMTGYRSRTLTFVAEYVAMYYFFNRRRFSMKLIVAGTVLFLLFLAAVGAYRRGAVEISSLAIEAGNIVVARPVMLELIVDNFNKSKFFWGARYFADFQKLLPGVQTGANVDLKYEVFPNADKMPETAGVTPSIVGEAYMNFGGVGIFWVMLFLGIVLGFSYKLMVRNPSFLRCAFYFTFSIGMAGAVASGIGTHVIQLIYLWMWVVFSAFLYRWRLTL